MGNLISFLKEKTITFPQNRVIIKMNIKFVIMLVLVGLATARFQPMGHNHRGIDKKKWLQVMEKKVQAYERSHPKFRHRVQRVEAEIKKDVPKIKAVAGRMKMWWKRHHRGHRQHRHQHWHRRFHRGGRKLQMREVGQDQWKHHSRRSHHGRRGRRNHNREGRRHGRHHRGGRNHNREGRRHGRHHGRHSHKRWRQGRHNKRWYRKQWYNRGSKHTSWNRYRTDYRNVKKQQRHEYKACMKKLEDAKYCKYRSRNSRHKLMKKYHEHNWNYNM